MKRQDEFLELIPAGLEGKLAWFVAVFALGLVFVAGVLAVDLHNQKKRLEDVRAQLKQGLALRESESKSLSASHATGEAALRRLDDLFSERDEDLKKLAEARSQREPLVKQATELRDKIQALVTDLLSLAQTDADARDIVRKYNIQQAPKPSSAAPAKP
jgi:DNA repair exonuclease SbcCD ATPase subunit